MPTPTAPAVEGSRADLDAQLDDLHTLVREVNEAVDSADSTEQATRNEFSHDPQTGVPLDGIKPARKPRASKTPEQTAAMAELKAAVEASKTAAPVVAVEDQPFDTCYGVTLDEQLAALAGIVAIQERVKNADADLRAVINANMLRLRKLGASSRSFDIRIPGLVEGDKRLGTATIPETQDAIKVEDRAQFTEWCDEQFGGDAVDYIATLKPGFEKNFLDDRVTPDYKTGDVVTSDGELVPGLKAVPGGQALSMKVVISKTDKQRIADALWSLSLLDLVPQLDAGPPAKVIDGEVITLPVKKAPQADLNATLAQARTDYPDSPEIEPGVTHAEAEAAAAHAMLVQSGFSTPEIEAKRLSADRARTEPADVDVPMVVL